MNTDSRPVRVTAAILVKDKRVLIAQRKPDDHLANLWEFPGGKIEDGETPEECLERELAEEFGIQTTVDGFLGSSTYRYPHISIELFAYRTTLLSGEIRLTDHAAFAWMPSERTHEFNFAPADQPFVEMIRRGEIEL